MFELLLGPIEQLRPEFVRMLTQQRRGRSWTCVTTRPGEGRTRHPELAEHFVGQRTPEATINNGPTLAGTPSRWSCAMSSRASRSLVTASISVSISSSWALRNAKVAERSTSPLLSPSTAAVRCHCSSVPTEIASHSSEPSHRKTP